MLYNAIDMERVDVVFLENLAITDMILILVGLRNSHKGGGSFHFKSLNFSF